MRVWIGCLACYSEGTLQGQWHDADEAGEVTVERVHGRPSNHEELWCMDIEDAPNEALHREMSPSEAQAIADHMTEIEDAGHPVEAFAAWADNIGTPFQEADLSDFEDAYAGEWDDEESYAYDYLDSTGEIDTDSLAGRYFDYKSFTRDLFMCDMYSVRAPGGRIYAFYNH